MNILVVLELETFYDVSLEHLFLLSRRTIGKVGTVVEAGQPCPDAGKTLLQETKWACKMANLGAVNILS